jgi:hypothetical protein
MIGQQSWLNLRYGIYTVLGSVGQTEENNKILSQAIRYPEHLANISEALPPGPVVTIIIITITITILVITCSRVFTITYLKQTMFLGYIMLQLFCSYNLCYM